MKKVIVAAVSGGVDSVVMLDMLAARAGGDEIIVAHFNHGIREDSDEDEEFVGGLAEKYGLRYEPRKENLGAGASEELARERRYAFLGEVAREYGGRIYTAHHADDVVESVAINLIRGTGWRGLVPLDSPEVERPMLGRMKRENIEYAVQNGLEWREDSTNGSSDYLRNRVRRKLHAQRVQGVLGLYERQRGLKREIDEITRGFVREDGRYERAVFADMDDEVALEVLRAILAGVGKSATIPQRRLMLEAIRTYGNGKKLNLLKDFMVVFSRSGFRFEKTI